MSDGGSARDFHSDKPKTFPRSGRPHVTDPTVPEEILEAIQWDARAPIPVENSDIGTKVTLSPLTTTPPHRLVVLGDSISHGFKSFAIADTHLAWPSLVARAAGFDGFRYPECPGPDACPGMPLNLEAVIRRLETHAPGSVLDTIADAYVLAGVRSLMDDVEDYWERGDGRDLVKAAGGAARNHNLAIWGWDVRDALSRTVVTCMSR